MIRYLGILTAFLFCMHSTVLATDFILLYDFELVGGDLTASKANALEKRIEKNPSDIESRTRLLGYYSLRAFQEPSARLAKQHHILWLIRNAPESDVLWSLDGHLDAILDGDAYYEAKKAWIDQLEKSPTNLKLLENSANFFLIHDRDLAVESLVTARSLDKENPEWPRVLGLLYWFDMITGSSDAKTKAAEKALIEFKTAYRLSAGRAQAKLLKPLVEAALVANRLQEAKEYAQRMLETADRTYLPMINIYYGNIFLGKIAFLSGDVEKAKEHMIKAGENSDSPNLDHGPNATLAKALFDTGETEAVRDYFENCSRFWQYETLPVDKWSAASKDDGQSKSEDNPIGLLLKQPIEFIPESETPKYRDYLNDKLISKEPETEGEPSVERANLRRGE